MNKIIAFANGNFSESNFSGGVAVICVTEARYFTQLAIEPESKNKKTIVYISTLFTEDNFIYFVLHPNEFAHKLSMWPDAHSYNKHHL